MENACRLCQINSLWVNCDRNFPVKFMEKMPFTSVGQMIFVCLITEVSSWMSLSEKSIDTFSVAVTLKLCREIYRVSCLFKFLWILLVDFSVEYSPRMCVTKHVCTCAAYLSQTTAAGEGADILSNDGRDNRKHPKCIIEAIKWNLMKQRDCVFIESRIHFSPITSIANQFLFSPRATTRVVVCERH